METSHQFVFKNVEPGLDIYKAFNLMVYEGVPIIFVGLDKLYHLYLCLCSDYRFGKQEWTISMIPSADIDAIVSQKKAIRDALLQDGFVKYLATYNYGTTKTMTYRKVQPFEIPEYCLPAEGAKLKYPGWN